LLLTTDTALLLLLLPLAVFFPTFFFCFLFQARDIHVITVATKNGLTPAHLLPGNKRDEGNNKGNGVGESAMKRPEMALFTPSFLV
jgi:hypothetical protein